MFETLECEWAKGHQAVKIILSYQETTDRPIAVHNQLPLGLKAHNLVLNRHLGQDPELKVD